MLRLTASTCLGLLLLSAPAPAGTLRGSISMSGSTPGNGGVDPREAVVWLEVIPAGTERTLARGPSPGWFRRRVPERVPVLLQSGLRFAPAVVSVVVKQPLEIRNEDSVWHGAFSVSPTHAFDLGKRPPGRADSVSFAQAGVLSVRCDIHPEMSATVVVTPNHARARPDSSGRWQLPSVPKGRYVLRAWAPGREELRREISVPRWGYADV